MFRDTEAYYTSVSRSWQLLEQLINLFLINKCLQHVTLCTLYRCFSSVNLCIAVYSALIFVEYATQAFEAIMAQEVTKRAEIEAQAKMIEAQIEDSKNQQIRMQHEERRKTLQVCVR